MSAFEWDARKNAANLRKHGVDFEEAIGIFDGSVLEFSDDRFDYGEERVIAVGELQARLVVVVYACRGETRRIISARKANWNERENYYKAVYGTEA